MLAPPFRVVSWKNDQDACMHIGNVYTRASCRCAAMLLRAFLALVVQTLHEPDDSLVRLDDDRVQCGCRVLPGRREAGDNDTTSCRSRSRRENELQPSAAVGRRCSHRRVVFHGTGLWLKRVTARGFAGSLSFLAKIVNVLVGAREAYRPKAFSRCSRSGSSTEPNAAPGDLAAQAQKSRAPSPAQSPSITGSDHLEPRQVAAPALRRDEGLSPTTSGADQCWYESLALQARTSSRTRGTGDVLALPCC